MVNIEPYQYQKTTNIKEHNDIVAKINEIVNVVNNTDLENIGPKIDAIEATDTLQWKDIESIKAKDTEQDSTLATHTTEITELTKSLVSNVALMNGTTAGNMKVRIERESAPSIDSNDYNIQKPTSVELVQGSAPAMVKAQITLSDGTVLISDDFMFTTEAIGQDVYISSFVFKNGNVAGTISADIGLSNGSTLTANNFAVPTDPNVLSTIADLTSRTEALEQIDIGALKTTVDGHTASIAAIDNDVADMMINKADVTNPQQILTNKRVDTEIVRYKYNDTDAYGIQSTGTENDPFLITAKKTVMGQEVYAPIGKLATLDSNGTPTNFKAGGEVWEEVTLSNFPTDWVAGDRIKVKFTITPNTSATNWTSNISISAGSGNGAHFIEIEINDETQIVDIPYKIGFITGQNKAVSLTSIRYVYPSSNFNAESASSELFRINYCGFNGANCYGDSLSITKTNITNYIGKMYRLKK